MEFEYSLFIAFMILFLHFCSWDDEIFEGIKKIVPPKGKWYKALYGCPVCMTPWWGTLIYWLFFGISWQNWLLTVGAAAGINVLNIILLSLREACVIYIKNNDK